MAKSLDDLTVSQAISLVYYIDDIMPMVRKKQLPLSLTEDGRKVSKYGGAISVAFLKMGQTSALQHFGISSLLL